MATVSKRIVLHFPKRLVDRPIVSRLVKDYNLDFNILKAFFTSEGEEGLMVLEITILQQMLPALTRIQLFTLPGTQRVPHGVQRGP